MASSGAAADGGVPANRAARALFEALLKDPAATHFKVLPDPLLYTDYYAAISRPVALAEIGVALRSGRYTLHDITRDLRRMVSNAKKYNRPDAQVYEDALALEVSLIPGAKQPTLTIFVCLHPSRAHP